MIRSSSYPSEFEEVVQNTGQDLARKGKYVFFPQFPLFQFQFLKKKWFVKYLSHFFLPQGSDFYTCDRCGGPNIIVDFGSTVFMISSWYAAFLSIFQFSNMKKSINIWLAPEEMNILSQLPFDVIQLEPSNLNICGTVKSIRLNYRYIYNIVQFLDRNRTNGCSCVFGLHWS